MSGYGLPLTRIFPNKNRIEDSVLIWENTGQRKLVFCHILHSVTIYNFDEHEDWPFNGYNQRFCPYAEKYGSEETPIYPFLRSVTIYNFSGHRLILWGLWSKILCLYRKKRVRENLCFVIFCALELYTILWTRKLIL